MHALSTDPLYFNCVHVHTYMYITIILMMCICYVYRESILAVAQPHLAAALAMVLARIHSLAHKLRSSY